MTEPKIREETDPGLSIDPPKTLPEMCDGEGMAAVLWFWLVGVRAWRPREEARPREGEVRGACLLKLTGESR